MGFDFKQIFRHVQSSNRQSGRQPVCTKPPNTASLQTALSRPAVFGYNADIKRIL
ncbi:Hypothetical protein NGK_0416 [Neisseria gonorrhoeae NCCP11945]|uniref:Uncharacterized protein n=1 Tax=Neisseria gonorrhoeae (strain NCCP11945) TaxID=521006 RepID=B4RJV6_NEIG2|nr:Hypothetical protein NGK_0416 [Neisseria gonorrhoeae NCCP11945]